VGRGRRPPAGAQRRHQHLHLRPRRAAHRARRRLRGGGLLPPRPARLHPGADRRHRHRGRHHHVRPLRQAHRLHRLDHHPPRLRRRVHRRRDRLAVPAGPLLRPGHGPVPHPGPHGGVDTIRLRVRGREPAQLGGQRRAISASAEDRALPTKAVPRDTKGVGCRGRRRRSAQRSRRGVPDRSQPRDW